MAGTGNGTNNPKTMQGQKTKGYLKVNNQAGVTKGQADAEYIKNKSVKRSRVKIWDAAPEDIPLDAKSNVLKVTPKLPPPTHGHELGVREENIVKQCKTQVPTKPPKKKLQITIRQISPLESSFPTKPPKKNQQIATIDIPPLESSFAVKERERRISLKARIKALKEENQKLRFRVEEEAELASQLKDTNIRLLNDLRKKCPPDVIARLEAENPDRE